MTTITYDTFLNSSIKSFDFDRIGCNIRSLEGCEDSNLWSSQTTTTSCTCFSGPCAFPCYTANKETNQALDFVDDVYAVSPTPIGPKDAVQVVPDFSLLRSIDDVWKKSEERNLIADVLQPLLPSCSIPERSQHEDDYRPISIAQSPNTESGLNILQDLKTELPFFSWASEASDADRSVSSSDDLDDMEERGNRYYQRNQWSQRYQELVQYRAEHGDCLVPHNWNGNRKLAQWVKRQRHQYQLKMQWKHSTLTDDRQQALEELGFVWEAHNAMWEEQYKELQEFRRQHGHAKVPGIYPTNPQLALWVKRQKRQCRLYLACSNETKLREPGSSFGGMTEERLRRLVGLGFDWKRSRRVRKASRRGSKAQLKQETKGGSLSIPQKKGGQAR